MQAEAKTACIPDYEKDKKRKKHTKQV